MPDKQPLSIQVASEESEPMVGGMQISPINFISSQELVPGWDSRDSDSWLRSFWPKFGNDILQAVLAVSVAKVQTQNWLIEGPEKLARQYRGILREDADFGRGWSSLIARGVQDYYTQNNGWFQENQRSSLTDYTSPVLGIAHLDSARMRPTGNYEYPYTYNDVDGAFHLLHQSQITRIVDLPSPVTGKYHHQRGFCALSRALSTAIVLSLLVTMKREKLSDLPPSAIAILNNISQKQFLNALTLHSTQEDQKGNFVWRSLLPLFGIDPAHPADLKFISLREVWEGFDEMTAYNIAVYSFAAAWRIDPREFWPVSAGPLGTGKEAEIQHEKAKAKSYGLLLTEIERALNRDIILPKGVSFRFVLQDSDEEQQRAQIHSLQIANIKTMQDAGASLTAAEVRWLLAKQYRIIPQAMAEVPEQATPQQSQPGMAPVSGALPSGTGAPAGATAGQVAPGIPNELNPVDNPGAQQPQAGAQPGQLQPSTGMSPKLSGIDIAYMDDVERETKELRAHYGLDMGHLIQIDEAGHVEYLLSPQRRNRNDNPLVSAVKETVEATDLLAKLKWLDPEQRKAILHQAAQLRAMSGFGAKQDEFKQMTDAEWEAAMASEPVPVEAKHE